MILPGYCQTMAAYNGWMNRKLYEAAALLSDEERKRDRAAFFGSIHSTLNHLLFGDRVWLPRLPQARHLAYEVRGMGVDIHADFAALLAARRALDDDISDWAARVSVEQLAGNLTWFSAVAQRDCTRPVWLCVMQMFNHQTHHRGQVTTLLKQAGVDPGVTDLPWAPLARDAAGRIVLGQAFDL